MFKFSAKQKLAIKSWFHAAIATEVLALLDFLKNIHKGLTLKEFFIAAGVALLAPISRSTAKLYSDYSIMYPWLKPVAAFLAKRALKSKAVATAKAHLSTPIPTTKP